MTFNTINIPNTAKRDGETSLQTFERIMSTFMGEYEVEIQEISEDDMSALGKWVLTYDKRFKNGTFPCAWIEDENGNIVEEFIYYWNKTGKWLKHEKIEL